MAISDHENLPPRAAIPVYPFPLPADRASQIMPIRDFVRVFNENRETICDIYEAPDNPFLEVSDDIGWVHHYPQQRLDLFNAEKEMILTLALDEHDQPVDPAVLQQHGLKPKENPPAH